MAVGVPVMQMARVRQNYLAIVVAAVACFLLEAGLVFGLYETWLSGIGRTMQWLMSSGVNPAMQYGTALVMAAVMATAISCVTQIDRAADGAARHQGRRAAVGWVRNDDVFDGVRLRSAAHRACWRSTRAIGCSG